MNTPKGRTVVFSERIVMYFRSVNFSKVASSMTSRFFADSSVLVALANRKIDKAKRIDLALMTPRSGLKAEERVLFTVTKKQILREASRGRVEDFKSAFSKQKGRVTCATYARPRAVK